MNGRARHAPLWAVTSLFGDCADGRRVANYRVFRAALGVPLVTVVLPFRGGSALGPGDADVLVEAAAGDELWQKERLLNVVLAHLPPDCEHVAWVDADVVFRDRRWPALAAAALERAPVAQLFERALECPRDGDPFRIDTTNCEGSSRAFAARWRDGDADGVFGVRAGGRLERDCATGMAWVARRAFLERFGFYDACIAGAGDRAMIGAMTGRTAETARALRMGAAFEAHYRAWAQPVTDCVRGRIGCVPGEVVHLWHGDPRRRGHARRHLAMHAEAYDPVRDVTGEPGAPWRFGSDKPRLRRFLREYFAGRRAAEQPG